MNVNHKKIACNSKISSEIEYISQLQVFNSNDKWSYLLVTSTVAGCENKHDFETRHPMNSTEFIDTINYQSLE